MDLGVGSFVFSSGLVSSRQKETSVLKQLWGAFRSSAMILFLGIVRIVLTKNLEYQVAPRYVHDLMIGTCYRVWSALEFLHYTGPFTTVRHAVTVIEMETTAVFSLRYRYNWRISMGNV
jgi:hypothetical protein